MSTYGGLDALSKHRADTLQKVALGFFAAAVFGGAIPIARAFFFLAAVLCYALSELTIEQSRSKGR